MKPRLFAILRKEVIHILRDPRSLVIVFIWPILMIFMYGYAITFNIKEIRLGLLDQDRSSASRSFVRDLTSSDYFKISRTFSDRKGIEHGMLERAFTAALIVPEHFGRDLRTESRIRIQLLVDGSNSNTATVAINYLRSFCALRTLELNAETVRMPVSVEPRVWYNPELKSAHFIVPGLVAVVMMMICALLTSVTLVRERETGTLEQILVSPIQPSEMVAGKAAPYILLALIDSAVVILFSILVFRVPFRGDALFLLLASLAYVYCALSIGVLISTRAKTQQVAMMAAMVSTFLPSFLLSGFVFPIASLPAALQAVSYLVPARYFLIIIRDVMLKGADIGHLMTPFLFLLGFGTLVMAVSVRGFKIRLED
jgi:ABC-2 type transport system permease protein